MIIIKLKGGLGNQLFQYAFACSLAYSLHVELFLDISYFSHNEPRKHVIYGLNAYNIKGIVGYYPFAEKTSVSMNYLPQSSIVKYDEGIKDLFPETFYDYEIVEKIEDLELPAFFDGYFQQQIKNNKSSIITENFFKKNNKIIHENLKYKLPISDKYEKIIKDMQKYDSVALHIRHGDYENIINFGLCSSEYYEKAIKFFEKKLDNPKFFIFTEDHEWVKSNLNFNSPIKHIYFNEKIDSYSRGYAELLKLMSSCKHFIIANSTYSWWGSFLSENKNKIIVTPKPWFQDRSIIETDSIDNVKTIKFKNNYEKIFNDSEIILYDLKKDTPHLEEICVKKRNNNLILKNLSKESKIYLENIEEKEEQNQAIINISLKTNNMNCLKIYYKTLTEDYCEKNTLSLYYYKNENINHYLIIPKEALIDSLLIKPVTLNTDYTCEIEIKQLKIKEKILDKDLDINQIFSENKKLKKELNIKNKILNTNKSIISSNEKNIKELKEDLKNRDEVISSNRSDILSLKEDLKSRDEVILSLKEDIKKKDDEIILLKNEFISALKENKN